MEGYAVVLFRSVAEYVSTLDEDALAANIDEIRVSHVFFLILLVGFVLVCFGYKIGLLHELIFARFALFVHFL